MKKVLRMLFPAHFPLMFTDEGTTPRVLILAYLVPAKKEAHSKDT
jgi:hypothetical protein